MISPGKQQELITTKLATVGDSIETIETAEYSLTYYGFLTLGNTNDTITLTINGIPGIEISMLGMVEIPIKKITLTAVTDAGMNSVTKGILAFGVKRYKTIF